MTLSIGTGVYADYGTSLMEFMTLIRMADMLIEYVELISHSSSYIITAGKRSTVI
jgi:hypothetical protein